MELLFNNFSFSYSPLTLGVAGHHIGLSIFTKSSSEALMAPSRHVCSLICTKITTYGQGLVRNISAIYDFNIFRAT
jgi:hypothetical protein